jgi:hypothetical protein
MHYHTFNYLSFITVICDYHSIQQSIAFYSLVTAGQENIYRHCEENISQGLLWLCRSSEGTKVNRQITLPVYGHSVMLLSQ